MIENSNSWKNYEFVSENIKEYNKELINRMFKINEAVLPQRKLAKCMGKCYKK